MMHTLSPRQETSITQAVREALERERRLNDLSSPQPQSDFEREGHVSDVVDEIKRVLRVEQ